MTEGVAESNDSQVDDCRVHWMTSGKWD